MAAHTPIEFFFKIPQDLFRGGTPTKPRFDYLRTMPPRKITEKWDVKIDPKTNKIDPASGGLSLFNSPDFDFGPDWWVLPSDTPLPPGFTLSKDLTNGVFKGHFTIRAIHELHVEVWKKTLKEWAEAHAIHISEFRRKAK
jgi:hypothetical protein